MNHMPYPRRSLRKRGFSLVETMVAVSISGMVMMGVLCIQYMSARTIKRLYGPTRARSERLHALNEIRFRLSNAQINSLSLSESGNVISFIDPTLGSSIRSAYAYGPVTDALYYDENISSGTGWKCVATGLIDVSFELGTKDLDPAHLVNKGVESAVTLKVKTVSELAYSNVDLRDGETVVCLKNP